MLRTDEILSTLQMLHSEHLDVRTVTLALNVDDCAAPSMDALCRKLHNKIVTRARRLVEICDRVGGKYGIPVVNKRLAISPASHLLAGHGHGAAVALAKTLDAATAECGINLVGGFTALVHKGITPADATVIEALPEVLATTQRVCASVNVATRKAGINMDAVHEIGHVILRIAAATAGQKGFGCAKLVVFSNIPEDNPFMAGAYVGEGEPEAAVNIGVSGPGVVSSALRRKLQLEGKVTLSDLAEEIKITSFRVTRVGELIGREVAAAMGVPFGIVDLSLAPTPAVGDSVGEILKMLGIAKIGAPGSTAAIAMLTDAVKKGGLFASSSVGGLSGAFIPVAEDAAMAEAVAKGTLSIEKLEAVTSICSVGLDMVPVPGDTSVETLASLIADELAIGVINSKTTAARIIPVPGKKAGQIARWGGLFGESPILDLQNLKPDQTLITRGGRIPAPIHSVRN